jgi:hypothetical protein
VIAFGRPKAARFSRPVYGFCLKHCTFPGGRSRKESDPPRMSPDLTDRCFPLGCFLTDPDGDKGVSRSAPFLRFAKKL